MHENAKLPFSDLEVVSYLRYLKFQIPTACTSTPLHNIEALAVNISTKTVVNFPPKHLYYPLT